MTTARFRLVDTHLRRMFTFVKLEVEVRLFARGFRSVIFADAVFTAADFSLADLARVRRPFLFAGEVFFLGAFGSVALEVVFAT